MKRVVGILALTLLLFGCEDALHDAQVNALGPEVEGVPPGPDHRPGQPCLTCHGSSGPGSLQFSVGGTIYTAKDQLAPLAGVDVHLVDSTSAERDVTTNRAGNFYVTSNEWVPVAPFRTSLSYQSITKEMATHIGRTGSCADCHFNPPGPASAGPIYLVLEPGDLPGASP